MTTNQLPSRRRGTALLVVLGVLLIAVTSSAVLLRSATITRLEYRTDHAHRIASDLLHQAENIIDAWLRHESHTIVLPLDACEPRVDIVADSWVAGGLDHVLMLTAWDQCGMVPWTLVPLASPLTNTVPSDVRNALEQVAITKVPPGMDLLVRPFERRPATRVFPGPHDTPGRPAIGACVASHNAAPGRINVNTAPLPLIEAALRVAGRGGIEHIVDARHAGAHVSITGLPSQARPSRSAPILTSQSNAWAFRVDLTVDHTARSWWLIFVYTTTWECVRRCVIHV